MNYKSQIAIGNINNCKQDNIQLDDLLCDEVMLAHLGTTYNKALIIHQLLDPTLMGLDIDEVCEMDMEMLISDVLQAQSLVMNEQADFLAMFELEQSCQEQPPTPVCIVPDECTSGEKYIHITFDKSMVEAYVLIDKPPECSASPNEQDIRTALLRSGIVYGIKDDYIDRFIRHPIYGRKIKMAEGKAPLPGIDGKVIYNFTPVFDFAPKIDENGIADYKALDYAQNVRKGDLLCDIIRSTIGVAGVSVCGDMITGSSGKPSGLVCGVNTVLSDDRTKLYASCDGQAFLKGRTVYVGRILVLDNVDSSTGNILFVGSVHVKGDVVSGFSVRAGGNITIDGIAESSVLVAGNNIVISGGVKGQGKGIVAADGNIRTLFIENARVQAKGNIYADSILNSQIESSCSVSVSGRNGKILGGVCIAGISVKAKQLGNDANLPTAITVRDPDTFGKRKAQNMLSIAKYKETVARLINVAEFAAASHLESVPPESMLCRAVVTKIRIERAIEALEIQNSETNAYRKLQRCIEVQDAVFPNVSLMIDDIKYKNDIQKPGCIISRVQDRLVFRTY